MTDKELEALWHGASMSREEAKTILAEAFFHETERLVEEVKKDSPGVFAKFLKSQNEQLNKLFGK